MKELPDLSQLDEKGKEALIGELWAEIQKLRHKQEKKPNKNAKNSSLPPAKGFKANINSQDKAEGKRAGSIGRAGGGRKLSTQPDQTVQAYVQVCRGCGSQLGTAEQKIQHRYDKLELPPIKPIVTRVEQYGCTCPQCGEQQTATVPVGLEPGSPYGNRIAALVTAMRYTHGISYNRMQQLLSEVFGLKMSEGAINNLLDCQYGIDAGDKIFSPVMKRILLRAIVLHRRWDSLAPVTQIQYRSRLKRDLERALSLKPERYDGQRLQRRYQDLRENLFLFLEDITIPPTNNSSEQAQQDEKVRNSIEGKFGEGKRRYSLGRVMTKLAHTSETAIAISFLVMNLERLLRQFFANFYVWLLVRQFSPSSDYLELYSH